jgi:hypothetical protein
MTEGSRVGMAVIGSVLALLVGDVDRATPEDLFADVTAVVGLDFVHFNGMTGRFYMPENMGAGGALLDYDNDGDLDLGTRCRSGAGRRATAPSPPLDRPALPQRSLGR